MKKNTLLITIFIGLALLCAACGSRQFLLIEGDECRAHLTLARRSTVQIGNHDERHHFAFRLVTVINLLRQFIQRRSKDIHSFVLPFQASGDGDQ